MDDFNDNTLWDARKQKIQTFVKVKLVSEKGDALAQYDLGNYYAVVNFGYLCYSQCPITYEVFLLSTIISSFAFAQLVKQLRKIIQLSCQPEFSRQEITLAFSAPNKVGSDEYRYNVDHRPDSSIQMQGHEGIINKSQHSQNPSPICLL